MEFSLLKKAMTDDDSAAVDQHLSTLTNYIREDANSLDGYTGKAADKTTEARPPPRGSPSSCLPSS